MRIHLVSPPILQINTPYPATAYLAGYLRSQNYQVDQTDMGLALALRVFSRQGVASIIEHAGQRVSRLTDEAQEAVAFFLESQSEYLSTIEAVVRFLQGQDDSLALRIGARQWLPEGPRFVPLHEHPELMERFGTLAVRDRAKYLASLYLDDIADMVRLVMDSGFELARYAESLAAAQSSFSPLYERLSSNSETQIDQWIDLETDKILARRPDVVGLSCPFPGNVYGGLRVAKRIKAVAPKVKIVMGGGFVSTELRDLDDPRFFEFVDFLCVDDGERPLDLILQHLAGNIEKTDLLRTRFLENGKVVAGTGTVKDVPFKDLVAPDYEGLNFDQYISMMEMPNPMHRMWSDFRWNKMTLAHGCYWRRCTFCDTSLDYIQRFEPQRVETIVAHMKSIAEATGSNGFHFVDEAAPPALLRALSVRLKEEGLPFTWWGNLRFDKQFDAELATLMAEAGCVAVTGGLEVASPRILEMIDKGVSVEQAVRVTKAFTEAGIFVHAYLMYGFPTETTQETIDSLEVVRQMFLQGCIQSAHWHRFVATIHSPVGRNPEKYGIALTNQQRPVTGWFARNAIGFTDPTPTNHDLLGFGLRMSVFNYMHGVGLDKPLASWFESGVPRPTVAKDFVRRALKGGTDHDHERRVEN